VILAGAKINVINNQFKTPLHMSIRSNDLDICKFLLSRGAKISFRKGRLRIDTSLDLEQIGSLEMKMFFTKYNRQQRKKQSASKLISETRNQIKELSKTHQFLCSQLQDESNRHLVASLASSLDFQKDNLLNKTKQEMCDMILTKLGILSISPNLY
jgi:ankyrin repeat protein